MTTAEFSHKSRRASIELRSDYRDWMRRMFNGYDRRATYWDALYHDMVTNCTPGALVRTIQPDHFRGERIA